MWRASRVSLDRTHHVAAGRELYGPRFDEVHSFHEPGLAPVRLGSEWFHIRESGTSAYSDRYDRAAGFYEGRAAVTLAGRSFHIRPDGKPAYGARFEWCGNFQEGLCVVRSIEGAYFHIRPDGFAAYAPRYPYAGDFREGSAVVTHPDGLKSHIGPEGAPINSLHFLDLTPFHKGAACARDAVGWFHIDRKGTELYSARFASLEPYYNGLARATTLDGWEFTIDVQGRVDPGSSRTRHLISRVRDGPAVRLVFDTSALLDLFGMWTDDHKERRGDLIKEVSLLAPLAPVLFSTDRIRDEVSRHLTVGGDLDRYLHFEVLADAELRTLPGFVETRGADYSLVAIARRLEQEGSRVFLLTKDRTFVKDLARAGLKVRVVPPPGFAEAITVYYAKDPTRTPLAHRLQNNTFVNLSRPMRLVKQQQGDAAYLDWQEFLNSTTANKHEMIEALVPRDTPDQR